MTINPLLTLRLEVLTPRYDRDQTQSLVYAWKSLFLLKFLGILKELKVPSFTVTDLQVSYYWDGGYAL